MNNLYIFFFYTYCFMELAMRHWLSENNVKWNLVLNKIYIWTYVFYIVKFEFYKVVLTLNQIRWLN